MDEDLDRPYPIVEGTKNVAAFLIFLAILVAVGGVGIAVLLWAVRTVF